jgi:HAD superfamily hydrolase (TIGR01493 family)
MTKAVIFDFSGTLFHCETTESWLRGALGQAGLAVSDAEVARYAARLHEVGAQPGGHSDLEVPAELAELWARRDLTPVDHRAAYTALTKVAGLPTAWMAAGMADILYDRHYAPEAWEAYPDTVPALELLRERGIPVAVLSNIGWDLRTVFKHFNLDHLVFGYVLSYEAGVKKPDPRIFSLACSMLGVPAADVLMVGDDPVADAGATAIGCAFAPVGHLPVDSRPRGLLDALGGIGV